MSAMFDGAAARLVNNSPPILDYPFSVGCWAMFTTAGTAAKLFGLTDIASTNNYFTFQKAGTDKLVIEASSAAASQTATIATADAVNTWFFALARFIGASNRRLSVLHAGGLIEHVQGATAVSPAGIDHANIGALERTTVSQWWPGLIGEFWWTDSDVQPDGGQLDDNFLRQLAYRGPFSVRSVAKDLIEYHKMRSSVPSRASAENSYFGKYGVQSWDNISGVAAPGPQHPPQPYEYSRPIPVARMLLV